MNGAEALVRTLLAGGVDTCFANPGTSEMHLVAALDRVEGMRCVLGLFEGVVTGAADGYARMAGKPAVTLLHLGPGLANGIANLHNAKKARSPILNLVGDHATYHRRHDAPLTADVEGLAAPVSHWLRSCRNSRDLARDGADALAASRGTPAQVATLIVPADAAWDEGGAVAPIPAPAAPARLDTAAIDRAARALLSGRRSILLINGAALREPGLSLAARIAARTGARLMGPTSAARAERGAGRPVVERIPYVVDRAVAALAGTETAILCGAQVPVNFFAYPGKPSLPLPEGCETLAIAEPGCDPLPALEALAEAVGARGAVPHLQPRAETGLATGAITPEALGMSIAAMLPEGAILIEESISSSFGLAAGLSRAPAHDQLQLTGGSIGIGIPLATGAAVAAPDRKVVCLQADGSGMYTLQGLWTQARERADVTTVILANRSYAILRHELANVGVERPGANALSMLDLGNPELDWVQLARGMGVDAHRATTMEEFNATFRAALAHRGPSLVEAVL
jgi:acetolactate synthase-1/2/3 large subunit